MPEPGGHGQEPSQQAQGEDHDADLDQHSRIRQVHWYDWGLSGIRSIRPRDAGGLPEGLHRWAGFDDREIHGMPGRPESRRDRITSPRGGRGWPSP